MPVRSTEWEGVYADGPWLLTRNLVPGAAVYGEGIVREKGREFRRWDANRSKLDRKSTRLNSSHVRISYAVFCLKKKKTRQVSLEVSWWRDTTQTLKAQRHPRTIATCR